MLYKLYSFIIALPLFCVATIITALIVIIAALCGDRTYTCYYLPRLWSRVTLWLFLIPVHVEGRENVDKSQSYVFLANHQGYFDIFLLYGYLGHNFKWMMKEYLKALPFAGLACQASGQIFVGESRSSIQNALEQADKTLRKGMSMVIFPEGTRSEDGEMVPFKRGAFTLASQINLPITPITINGSFKVFNRHAWSVTRHPLRLTIHPAITPEERQGLPTKQLMQQTFDIIHNDLDVNA